MTRPATRDQGSAGVEAAIAVTSLMMVGFFIIGALRVTNTGGDVDAAARSATRAAAAEYDDTSAYQVAQAVAASELADRGVACEQLDVQLGGSLAAGGVITVDVTCVVSLADVVLAGFPGSKTVSGRGVEQVDVVRGGG
jgi:Flp pilus assembly protein TadG